MNLANVALPSFLPHSIMTLVGLLLIAAIEALILQRFLPLKFTQCYPHTLTANWKSTVIGIPIAWCVWVAGLVPISMGVSALGLEPHPAVASTAIHTAFFGGVMPSGWTRVGSAAGWLVLLVPFWFGSVWIERKTLFKRLPESDRNAISKAVVWGNLASYLLFLIFGLFSLLTAVRELPLDIERFEKRQLDQEKQLMKMGKDESNPSLAVPDEAR